MSIRRMQCSLFLLLLVLAPALGEGVLGLDGLVSTPGNGTNYHVSALFTFYLRTKVWNSNLFSPQKHQKPEGRPLTVTGELNLRNIQEVDDSKMVISLEISLRCKSCPAACVEFQSNCRMYWKDTRLTHNQAEVEEMEKKGEPLPTTESPLPGSKSGNKSYILLKDPEDIKRLWKPDVFIDQAITIR